MLILCWIASNKPHKNEIFSVYMLDTNMCIFVLKNRSVSLIRKFNAIKNLTISSITYGELRFGIENGEAHLRVMRLKQLEQLLQKISITPWDAEAGEYYGVIRATLKKQGLMIGQNDLLIAAHARSLECVLVTNNTREFSRVNDLSLEDWTQE